MKKAIYLLLALLITFALIGCKGAKPTVTKETTVRDSVSVQTKIVPRDTLIKIPEDSVQIKVPIKHLSETPIRAKSTSGDLTAQVSRIEDEVIVDCNLEGIEKKLELLDKEIEILKSTTTTSSEVVEKPVKYIPWYVEVLAWIGGIVLVYAIGLLGAKFIKPF